MQKIITSSLRRNNLDKSASPYLLQHMQNPVWWQEWSSGLIRYAAESGTPLFVSSGYATCHWCHVMASEAFSDQKTADFLNNNFICIKIDREQRPDIDQFMMDFINRQNGSGGWPLNVFFDSTLKPVYALTYAPAGPTESMHSFYELAESVMDYIKTNGDKIPSFSPSDKKPSVVREKSLLRMLSGYYDAENGGFGNSVKFPPHSTLLFLLYQQGIEESPSINTICNKSLEAMMDRGLHDHLQGGIFRYCVDSAWSIPHFEKMLYDQAMALWVYSLAHRITGRNDYKMMTEKILRCLDESFLSDGLYITAHDADTDHSEGDTYLWSYDQLLEALSAEELLRFTEAYHISREGNFRGSNHLIRKSDLRVDNIEEKLLQIRNKRKQPSRDEKILSGINALTAAAMIHAGRYLIKPSMEGSAASLINKIREKFWNGRSLGHSIFKGVLQEQSFLFDASAMLYAVGLLSELDPEWNSFRDELAIFVESFREGEEWIESRPADFRTVPASWFDHPVPSGVSLAEASTALYSYLKGEDVKQQEYREPFQSDFYNINVMMRNGLFHIYTAKEFIEWSLLPVNSIQVRGEHEQDCYMNVCRPLTEADITAITLRSPL